MKITGKELFVANKLLGLPNGIVYYRTKAGPDIYKMPLMKAIDALCGGRYRGFVEVDFNKILMKRFLSPTTTIKDAERKLRKTIGFYFAKHYKSSRILIGDLALDEAGVLVLVSQKNFDNGRYINLTIDVGGSDHYYEDKNLMKL